MVWRKTSGAAKEAMEMPRITLGKLAGLLAVADPGGTSLRLVAPVMVFTLLAAL